MLKGLINETTKRQYRQQAQELQERCLRCGRKDVLLLAVSKTFPLDALLGAYAGGAKAFGESYVQEAVDKIEAFRQMHSDASVQWHFIGPIQSNKVKWIAQYFDWVQSVDRRKIVQRLARLRGAEQPPLNVLIEVNLHNERSKSGVLPEQVPILAAKIARYENLVLRGVMAIPKDGMTPRETARAFAHLRQIYEQLAQDYPSVDTLSMGMSQDWKIAVQQGSTCVRIGRAIFGARRKKGVNQ